MPTTADDRDERLALLLDDLIQRQRGGESVSLERTIEQNPDLSRELRELWAAVMIADAVAASTLAHEHSEHGSVKSNIPAPATTAANERLPRRLGDFELLSELGRGGMGVVYQARQVALDRMVALKMILRGANALPGDLARFRAEAEAVAKLEHPGIVPVYEVGELEGQPYFSMQFIIGTTLARMLAEGPLPPRQAAEILAPICRAIHFAHGQGLLHRDLKPSNILIDLDGKPHVTDFGLAKKLNEDFATTEGLTHTGAILGTPSYMAPEQAAGNRGEIGPASDVYSLGTILYAMLTGRPPFQAANPVDTVLMVLEQDPLPPRLVNVRADRDLELIALKALQKPPELRYASAEAMARDLEAYLTGETISARSGGINEVVARVFRETHHATILRNWGLLWMWHSVVLFGICLITNFMAWRGVDSRWAYLLFWSGAFAIWAPIFWALRWRNGPVTAIERQIAHVWASSVIATIMLFFIEYDLNLPALKLAPVLAIISAMVFIVKAGMLSGKFYIPAGCLILTAGAMARWPEYGHTIFGVVSGLCFFIPGLVYYRQRLREELR
jgi:hypothetical protein